MNLQEILYEVFDTDTIDIREEVKIREIENWDSMNHMILIEAIESNYNLTFTGEQIANIETIKDIKTYLYEKGFSE